MQLDKYGNNPKTSRFESELALIILEQADTSALQKFNQAILRYIDANLELTNSVTGVRKALYDLDIMSYEEYKHTTISTAEKLKQLFNSKLTPNTIIQCISAHKLFTEDILKPFYSYEKIVNPKPAIGVKSLRAMAQDVIQQQHVEQRKIHGESKLPIAKELSEYIRPEFQFGEEHRGRGGMTPASPELKDPHFGIMSREDLPEWAAQWFSYQFEGAKETYQRDYESFMSSLFEAKQLPFISGPSGTMTHCLTATILLNIDLSASELKEYAMTIAGAETALGHHSLMEVALVAANLYLYHMVDSSGELYSLTFLEEDSDYAYQYFLTDSVKSSPAYQKLITKYPEYFTSMQQIADYLLTSNDKTKQHLALEILKTRELVDLSDMDFTGTDLSGLDLTSFQLNYDAMMGVNLLGTKGIDNSQLWRTDPNTLIRNPETQLSYDILHKLLVQATEPSFFKANRAPPNYIRFVHAAGGKLLALESQHLDIATKLDIVQELKTLTSTFTKTSPPRSDISQALNDFTKALAKLDSILNNNPEALESPRFGTPAYV